MPVNPSPSRAQSERSAPLARVAEIHISSLIVQHDPTRTDAIRDAASVIDGLEWCAAENGKAIVTLVTPTAHAVLDHIDALNALPGVHTATMVYHHCEPADAIDAPLS